MHSTKKSLGIYIHIPFCIKRCDYCDFFSTVSDSNIMQEYVKSVIKEIQIYSQQLKSHYIVDTIYFGGGTPVALFDGGLEKIIHAINNNFICKDAELTIECNPYLMTQSKIDELLSIKATRLSVGVQTLNKNSLQSVGRDNGDTNILSLLKQLISLFPSVSVDLMLGLPHSTKASVIQDAEKILGCGIKHISAYSLKVEKGTRLEKNIEKGLKFPDEDEQVDMYECLASFLEGKGMIRYEVSNFAYTGFESKHNLRYWMCEDYLGIGASAHSLIMSERFNNPSSLSTYIKQLEKGLLPREGIQKLTQKDKEMERIMLGLRTNIGVVIDNNIAKSIQNSIYSDCFIINNDILSITGKYLYSMNTLINFVLDLLHE